MNPVGSIDLKAAVETLGRGGLVAFPTETVYGLGADAESPEALRLLYQVKGRPQDHPVIVHLGEAGWLSRYAKEVPPAAQTLVEKFWPGPLTLILPRSERVPDQVTGGGPTVGLRMPNHPLALELLRSFGRGLAAPSANRFGEVSPTRAQHVRRDLGDQALVLDGGPCQVGIESTIVAFQNQRPVVVRPGRIAAEELAETLGYPVTPVSQAISAPGTLEKHYAPRTPTRLVDSREIERLCHQRAAVWSRRPPARYAHWLEAPTEPQLYARLLYQTLRELDAQDCDCILIEKPPEGADWRAIHDRLARATAS